MIADPKKLRHEPVSVRRRVSRNVLRLSLLIGSVSAVLAAILYLVSSYPSLQRWEEINLQSLSEIHCTGDRCDTSEFTTDWQLNDPDYIVDTHNRYFLSVPEPAAEGSSRFAPLDYSDINFIRRFRQPTSYEGPDGELWRLYSREASIGGRKVEVIVGYAEKVPWKMLETPSSTLGLVDKILPMEAEKLVNSISSGKMPSSGSRAAANTDGFEVVDASTGQVLNWGPWLPIFFSPNRPLPSPGRQLYIDEGELYVIQTNTDGRLLATSVVRVGRLWWIVGLAGIVFAGTSTVARYLGWRFLRSYFAVAGAEVPSLQEALQIGEGQCVEFKRGISTDEGRTSNFEHELLESIAAFANTNDGLILIGVDDSGHLKGLSLDYKQRDRLEQKIRQLVWSRLRPTPPLQVGFEDLRGLGLVKITVSRGEAPVYMLDGVIYVRNGSSDIRATPEEVTKLVTDYAR
jgi:hypothetical protein